jgi:periplasmic divalent cation tolerance protein
MADDICEVIITAPDKHWLVSFTRQLIEHGLAACGHHTEIRSIYSWEGSVQDTSETRVALHTRTSHVQTIIEATNAAHPYQVPCVIAVPIISVDPAYQAWVLDSTR